MLVSRKHKELSEVCAFLGAVKHIIIIFIFEDQKLEKLGAGLKGLKDGMKEKR